MLYIPKSLTLLEAVESGQVSSIRQNGWRKLTAKEDDVYFIYTHRLLRDGVDEARKYLKKSKEG